MWSVVPLLILPKNLGPTPSENVVFRDLAWILLAPLSRLVNLFQEGGTYMGSLLILPLFVHWTCVDGHSIVQLVGHTHELNIEKV